MSLAGLAQEALSMLTPSLPIPATSFVGRDEELARIANLLADPACRLLTLLGPGGIGKTRLALQFVATQAQFVDGANFVPLTPVSAPDLVPSAIASTLHITFYNASDLRRQLADYLGEKQMLLVMDNFEHLLNGVDLLTDLLQAAPDVKFLVTSRERLNVQEEWVLLLDGLSFPEGETNTSLESYSAVQLFAQRARQVQVNFSLNESPEAVRKICQQVEGMPLGLELAATWLRAMSPQQIAAHMQSNLGFLTTPLRNVAERHRSFSRVFEQSWKLLSADEQNVLMRLSVFRGGFDLDAAQQVAGASLPILASLADKSLIRVNRDGRYDLHELLRQYAEGHLDAAGAAEAARTAHSGYYLRFVAQRDEDIKGRRQQLGLHEIRTDLENIRAGLLWAVDHEQHALITTPVLDCLVNFGEMGNRSVEMCKLLKQTEAALGAKFSDANDPLLDQVAICVERMNATTGIEKNDHHRLEAILERERQRGGKREIAHCLSSLGESSDLSRDHMAAISRYEECLRLWQEVGDDFYVAHTLHKISGNYFNTKRREAAIEALDESVRICRRTGDLCDLANFLLLLSYFYILKGDISKSAQIQDEVIDINNEIGPISSYPIIKAAKATWSIWLGDVDSAIAEAQAGDQFMDEQVYKTSTNFAAILDLAASLRGDYRHAYDNSLRHILNTPSFVPEWDQFSLAVAACGLGENDRAHQALHFLLTKPPSDCSPTWQRLCLPIAAILAARANQPEWAAELLGLALAGPHEITGWMENWPLLNEVREQLELQLGTEAFRIAWEHGKSLHLDAVACLLVEHGQRAPMTPAQTANRLLMEPLSERELDVLRLIAAGLSNHAIADHLVISVTTVKKHVNHIFGKLRVESRTQAIAHAQALNLL
jgi:predicted ATPase/DNA-binding CsgD family transcriptional regulator